MRFQCSWSKKRFPGAGPRDGVAYIRQIARSFCAPQGRPVDDFERRGAARDVARRRYLTGRDRDAAAELDAPVGANRSHSDHAGGEFLSLGELGDCEEGKT